MPKPRRLVIPQDSGQCSIRVSRYDQVASTLVTSLIVFGCVTLLMFLMWLSTRDFGTRVSPPVTMLEDVGGGGSGQVLGTEQQFEEPSPQEAPQTAATSSAISLEQRLNSVASVVASNVQELEAVYGSPSVGTGEGTGTGSGKGKGPGGPGTADGIPAYERWEIRMSAANIDEYAKQLDFFKVELGVAGGGSPNVDYISNLSSPRPTVRTADPKEEHRLRFLHRSGELRAGDRQLAERAGVKTEGRIVFQFYDQATYQMLLRLEAEAKGSRRIKDVRKTVFGVKSVAARYEFYVVEQHYLGTS
jgi:hypothetical protein